MLLKRPAEISPSDICDECSLSSPFRQVFFFLHPFLILLNKKDICIFLVLQKPIQDSSQSDVYLEAQRHIQELEKQLDERRLEMDNMVNLYHFIYA